MTWEMLWALETPFEILWQCLMITLSTVYVIFNWEAVSRKSICTKMSDSFNFKDPLWSSSVWQCFQTGNWWQWCLLKLVFKTQKLLSFFLKLFSSLLLFRTLKTTWLLRDQAFLCSRFSRWRNRCVCCKGTEAFCTQCSRTKKKGCHKGE